MSGSKKKRAAPPRPSGPYREGGVTIDPGESDGLVGDLVRQFADPYALFRELVQNAIDAGASAIDVKAVISTGAGRERGPDTMVSADGLEARLSVSDDGCGMTQEVLEEDLVVLFRSTKENVEGMIGKFGIGFVSVLALAPSLVVVSSSTGDGVRHLLHLHPDRSYDLYREPGTERGTTVTLHVPLEGDESELVARSEAALRRWCGHAGVPIRWSVVRSQRDAPSEPVRIDGPLEIAGALVDVHARSYDDRTEALVALVPESARSAAYYNRGLLLHESRDRGTRASIAFKVVDPRLSHTLSREDVRLDEAHARAVALVEHTIAVPLTAEVRDAIGEAARAHVAGDPEAGARWLALVSAARAAELAIEAHEIDVPVLAPVGGARVARCLGVPGPRLVADARDALIDVLAASGMPVVDRTLARDEEARRTLDGLLAALGGSAAVAPHALHTALVPVQAPSESERAVLDRVASLLATVLRKPKSVHFVDVIGRDPRLSFALAHLDAQLATELEDEADPFRLALRPALALARSHPVAKAAIAHPDPILAADTLARAVMIERGLLTASRSDTLLETSLRALVGGGR